MPWPRPGEIDAALTTTEAESAAWLAARDEKVRRERDEEYRAAFGMKWASGEPMLPETMTPELAKSILEAMRLATKEPLPAIAVALAARDEQVRREALEEGFRREEAVYRAVMDALVATESTYNARSARGIIRAARESVDGAFRALASAAATRPTATPPTTEGP
jgi:hypothetical protein